MKHMRGRPFRAGIRPLLAVASRAGGDANLADAGDVGKRNVTPRAVADHQVSALPSGTKKGLARGLFSLRKFHGLS